MKKTIKILGHDIKVRTVSHLKTEGNMGTNCIYNNEILLSKELSGSAVGATLLHEILENICGNCQLELSHQVLTVIGEVLYQVLVDNPDLFDLEEE